MNDRKIPGSITDKIALAIASFGGVGCMPIAPATWGSMVTAVFYFLSRQTDDGTVSAVISQATSFSAGASSKTATAALIIFVFLIGTWAASRGHEDNRKQ